MIGQRGSSPAPAEGGCDTSEASAPAPESNAGRDGWRLLEWRYERFLVLLALSVQLLGIIMITGGSLATLIFVLPITAPAVIFSALALTKGKPWMYLAAAITLALLPVLALSFAAGFLSRPQLGPIFAGVVLLLLSLALGLPAGVAAFRRRRAPPPHTTLREGLRSRSGLLAVLTVGACLGAVLTGEAAYLSALSSTTSGAGADLAPEANVTITVENYAFAPRNVSIPAGKLVEVTVVNKDGDFHTFTYTVYAGTPQERTYSHDLLPSSTTKFTTLISSPATVHFWCVPHSPGMAGDFTVS